MDTPVSSPMDSRTAASEIAGLRYDIRIDGATHRVAWGDKLKLSGTLATESAEALHRLSAQFEMKIGLRVFDGADKVRESRGAVMRMPAGAPSMPIELLFDTDYLRPGRHRCELDLVIDTLRWFGKPRSVDIDVERSDAFVDVKTFAKDLGVEELAVTADAYYSTNADNEWMYRKPFAIKDIQHNWPQIAVLIRGLNFAKGMSVIDFGAGTGWITRTLSSLGLDVVCLDVSQTALDIGARIADSEKVLFDRPPIRFTRFDGRRIPVADASIDRILCNDALHHVPNVDEVLAEMGRVLRPGGIAGFCEPGPRHSLHPRAQQEMKQFRVLENDIDIEAIRAVALQVGFRRLTVSLFSPYPVDIEYEEWKTLTPASPAIKRFADQAFQRMKSNTLFFLHK